MQMVQKVSELVKDINKYADELHKKHKVVCIISIIKSMFVFCINSIKTFKVKEDESGTLEAVQAIQSTTLMVQKAKDLYTQKGLEVDKLKKESASPKDIEKAEIKLKKAYEDYKAYVEKYSVIKDDFERKMSITCRVCTHLTKYILTLIIFIYFLKHFQEIEEAHLTQMKQFLQTYAEVVHKNHDLVGQVSNGFDFFKLDILILEY